MANNFYDALGVSKKATKQEIKKAYQKLAKKWHPDVNKAPEAEAKFKEAAEAYDVLGNVDKRKLYDEEQLHGFGRGGVNGRATSGASARGSNAGGSWSGGYSSGGAGIPEDDLFGMFFGKGGAGDRGGYDFFSGSAGRPQNGSPWGDARSTMQAQLDITLEQAYKGGNIRVQVGDKNLDVNIPARSYDGTVIRIQGTAQNGIAQDSDLMLILHILPHDIYELSEGDLHGVVEIAPWEAALGGEVKVPLPGGGAVKLKIPVGIQGGKTLRIPGKGLKRENGSGSNGDILFEIEIVVPEQISESDKSLYRKLAESSNFKARPRQKKAGPQRRKSTVGR